MKTHPGDFGSLDVELPSAYLGIYSNPPRRAALKILAHSTTLEEISAMLWARPSSRVSSLSPSPKSDLGDGILCIRLGESEDHHSCEEFRTVDLASIIWKVSTLKHYNPGKICRPSLHQANIMPHHGRFHLETAKVAHKTRDVAFKVLS